MSEDEPAPDTEDNASPKRQDLFGMAWPHLGLIATLGVFTLMALRVAVVARLDPTTSVTLIAETGPVPIAVNLLTEFVAVLVALIIAECLYGVGDSKGAQRWFWIALLLMALILGFFTMPMLLVLGALPGLLGALSIITYFRWKRDPSPLTRVFIHPGYESFKSQLSALRDEGERIHADLVRARADYMLGKAVNLEPIAERQELYGSRTAALEAKVDYAKSGRWHWRLIACTHLPLLALFVLVTPYWQPTERLVLEGLDAPTVGYVVTEDDWLTIMREEDRSVFRIRADQLEERSICAVTSRRWNRAPAHFVFDIPTPEYEPCFPDDD